MSKVSKFMKVRRPMIFAIISQSLFTVPIHSSVSIVCQLPLFSLSPLVSGAGLGWISRCTTATVVDRHTAHNFGVRLNRFEAENRLNIKMH